MDGVFFLFVLKSNILKLAETLEENLEIPVVNAKVVFKGDEDFNYFIRKSENPRKYRSTAVGYICVRHKFDGEEMPDSSNILYRHGVIQRNVIAERMERFIHQQFGGGYIESVFEGSKIYTFYLVDDAFVTL